MARAGGGLGHRFFTIDPMDDGEQRWVLKALREAGEELIDQFHGLAEKELCWRPHDDEWSLKEIAGHLRDNEELALEQMSLIAGEEEPELPARDVDAMPLEVDYRSADVKELLGAFARLRRQTHRLLWSLAPEDWGRRGRHPYRGEVTIAQIARELAEHDLGHLWQARRLRETLQRG
jgi:hypothetical protein